MLNIKKLYSNFKSRIFDEYYRLGYAFGSYQMRFKLLLVRTHVDLSDDFVFDEKKAVSRGREAPDGKTYSSTYELAWSDIPDTIKEEIRNYDSVLRLYFGGDYLINTSSVYRNHGLPEEFRSLDIYSQVWHYDHVVDYCNVQLMVLLSDTTDLHGPFEYVKNPSAKHIYRDAQKRNGANIISEKVGKLTGVRGDGIWFATGSMPHRAGIPIDGNFRDMMSVAMFPKHTGIGVDPLLLFGTDSR